MTIMTWVYRIILLAVVIGVCACMWTEKDGKRQINNAIVLIPLILRVLMIK